jgi:hypothetical protein
MSQSALLTTLGVLIIAGLAVGVLLFRSAKSGGSAETRDHSAAISELAAMGFFDAIAPDERDPAQREAAESGFPFGHDALDRQFMADAESLAEGGVGELLEELRQRLARVGADPGTVTQSFEESEYWVEVAGRRVTIWTAEEVQAPGQGGVNHLCLAVQRTQLVINRLLSEAGAEERVYWTGAEDGFVYFMTPEMQRVIESRRLLTGRDLPQIVTCE